MADIAVCVTEVSESHGLGLGVCHLGKSDRQVWAEGGKWCQTSPSYDVREQNMVELLKNSQDEDAREVQTLLMEIDC